MSCSRGNITRNRPQKHQNKTAFKNDLHDTSKKTKILNNLEVTGVCERCKEIIEWKIKYKKYKTLNAPRKCVGCEQKRVKYAYHVLCGPCATEKNICAKCCKPNEVSINHLSVLYDAHSMPLHLNDPLNLYLARMGTAKAFRLAGIQVLTNYNMSNQNNFYFVL